MKLFKAVNANNLTKVKKYLDPRNMYGTSVPREAVKTCEGFDDEDVVRVTIEASQQVEVFATDMMNPLELACVRGHASLLSYLVNECNYRSRSEFQKEFGPIESMPFIFVPLLQKNGEIMEILLNISTLWTLEDLKNIFLFMK